MHSIIDLSNLLKTELKSVCLLKQSLKSLILIQTYHSCWRDSHEDSIHPVLGVTSSHLLLSLNVGACLAMEFRESNKQKTQLTSAPGGGERRATLLGSTRFLCLFELLQRSDDVLWVCMNTIIPGQERFEHWNGNVPSFPPPLLPLFWAIRAWHASSTAASISLLDPYNTPTAKHRWCYSLPARYCKTSSLWK